LVRVERKRFNLFTENARIHSEINYWQALDKLKRRLPPKEFACIRSSTIALYRYSSNLFPAFRELLPEFLASEWSALVDVRKGFHREHIVHQAQTAVVVRKLLLEMEFSYSDIENNTPGIWNQKDGIEVENDSSFNLLDICALVMLNCGLESNSKTGYKPTSIRNYAHILGLYDYFDTTNNKQQAFERWRKTIYIAAITAACYHDVGYVFSFAGDVLRPLLPFSDFCAMNRFDAEYLQRTASNTLFMHNFTGIYDWSNHLGTRLDSNELRKIIQYACEKSHGLHSAHAFVNLNEYLRDRSKPLDPWAQLIIQWAASAMLMHDLQKVREKMKEINEPNYNKGYLRVALMEDPVAFVVTLADQIQAYNRYNTYAECNKTRVNTGSAINLSLESLMGNVKLDYRDLTQTKLIHDFSTSSLQKRGKVMRVLHKDKFFPQTLKEYYKDKGYLESNGLFNITELC
jgi:hypothetical protein